MSRLDLQVLCGDLNPLFVIGEKKLEGDENIMNRDRVFS